MTPGAILLIVIVGAFVAMMVHAAMLSPEGRRTRIQFLERRRVARLGPKAMANRKISDVADRGIGVLACPVCGGAQFKARRSKKARAGVTAATVTLPILGAAAFAGTRRTRVECTTCGTVYRRG
jgi:hypothetical protein